MQTPVDTAFIHDLSQLDKLRQKAMLGDEGDHALKAAAGQFEALFTQMLFNAMRKANDVFESDLLDNRTSKFYQQMADEQLSSALSQGGALGLADLIVEQMKGALGNQGSRDNTSLPQNSIPGKSTASLMKDDTTNPSSTDSTQLIDATEMLTSGAEKKVKKAMPVVSDFTSPSAFVTQLLPLAKIAANQLKTDPLLLLAQAALETGWGKKVITNANGSSHNLFNIKADRRWQGNSMNKATLEFEDGIVKKQRADFRAYASFKDSFSDFVAFLQQNPRYKEALSHAKQPDTFIRAIQAAGYATDPNYADKVLNVFKQIKAMAP